MSTSLQFIALSRSEKVDNPIFLDALDEQELYVLLNPGRWIQQNKRVVLKIDGRYYDNELQNQQDIIEVAMDHPWQDIKERIKINGFKNLYLFNHTNMEIIKVGQCVRLKKDIDKILSITEVSHIIPSYCVAELFMIKDDLKKEVRIIRPTYYEVRSV